MSRRHIIDLKRLVAKGQHATANEKSVGLAKEALLHLLERSIRFGHARLSVLRLSMAARSGAVIPLEYWEFCQRIAEASSDSNMRALFMEAAQSATATFEPDKTKELGHNC